MKIKDVKDLKKHKKTQTTKHKNKKTHCLVYGWSKPKNLSTNKTTASLKQQNFYKIPSNNINSAPAGCTHG